MRRKALATDADLARRLEQIELLFDLHSAGMATRAVSIISERLGRVRAQLQERARHDDLLRAKLIELRKN